jgi:hypothetical protein
MGQHAPVLKRISANAPSAPKTILRRFVGFRKHCSKSLRRPLYVPNLACRLATNQYAQAAQTFALLGVRGMHDSQTGYAWGLHWHIPAT